MASLIILNFTSKCGFSRMKECDTCGLTLESEDYNYCQVCNESKTMTIISSIVKYWNDRKGFVNEEEDSS